MFKIFPTNYIWNLSTNIALNTGGHIDEVLRICSHLSEAATRGDDEGTEQFFRAWCDMADALVARADVALAAGHRFTASDLLARAGVYYLTAERMQSRHFEPRTAAYRAGLDATHRSIELGELPVQRVEIPYGSTTFPGYFIPAPGMNKAPVMVMCNGLDSFKESALGAGLGDVLGRRGISALLIDQPGTGESLRLRDLVAVHDSERWASRAVDYLQGRPDVDVERIGIMGWSLGGYFAPRAAAFEPRFKVCVAWGANYDWGELQRRRAANEGDRPVPHYWDHVQWVFGKGSLDDFMDFAPQMTLKGVVEQIKVPSLVTHGDADSQIPREYAYAQHEGTINSPRRELKFFTAAEGGSIHASADNIPVAASFIADWVADVL